MKFKRMLALLLSALSILALFAGCSSSQPAESQSADVTAETSTQQPESAPDAQTQASDQQPAETGDSSTLLTEETYTFTMWFPWSPRMVTLGYDSPNDFVVYPELEKRTNVHIDFTTVGADVAREKFNLMAVSGDWTDLLYNCIQYFDSGADKAVEDGAIIDLSGLIDQYAPNYKAVLEEYPEFAKDATTDSGIISKFSRWAPGAYNTQGNQIRQDWLDQLGLDAPVTYSDWYDVLTAFKVELGVETPLIRLVPADGFEVKLGTAENHALVTDSFYVENGVVKNSLLEANYKSYLELANQWFNDGLISLETVAEMNTPPDRESLVLSGSAGIWSDDIDLLSAFKQRTTDANFEATAISSPVQNQGDVLHVGMLEDKSGDGIAITTNCQNVELAMRYVDYWYTDEGSLLCNYGVEGVSFEYNDQGKPEFMDVVANDEEGMNMALFKYAVDWGPFVMDWSRKESTYDASQLNAIKVWNNNPIDWKYPMYATMTVEESERFNAINGDVATYVEEMQAKFIIGEVSLDQFDQFVTTIKSLGMEEAVQIKQNAYDRYMQR